MRLLLTISLYVIDVVTLPSSSRNDNAVLLGCNRDHRNNESSRSCDDDDDDDDAIVLIKSSYDVLWIYQSQFIEISKISIEIILIQSFEW